MHILSNFNKQNMGKFGEVLGNAKVFYRIHPSENPDWDYLKLLDDEKTIQLKKHSSMKSKTTRVFKQFETDGFFYNKSQKEIYSIVMNGVLESVFQGQNSIIVAFGQTGSGKSLTIGGVHCSYQDRGLVPRTIEDIFILKEKFKENNEIKVYISYLEILSSFQSRDLLKPYPSPVEKKFIHKQLSKVEVENELQTLQIVFLAEARKEYTAETKYLSHAGSSIITFEFTIKDTNFSIPHEITSRLHIIDLAGNDRLGDKSSIFKNRLQVGSANSTKSFLEHLMLLINGNDSELVRVKQRTTIFSEYLGNTLNGSSLMRLIGHLKTSKDDHNISMSLLGFGQVFKSMKFQSATVISKENELTKIAVLEEKLHDLHREQLIEQMIQNQEPKAVCLENLEHMRRIVADYLNNRIDGIRMLKMGNILTILKLMKESIKTLQDNEMLSKTFILENFESSTAKPGIAQKIPREAKIEENIVSKVEKTDSNTSRKMSAKNSLKDGNIKKTPSPTKSKKDSLETDVKSINRKGKPSIISLSGIKRPSTVGKKRMNAAAESIGSAERTSKKSATDNHQASSLLNTINLILPDIIPEQKEALLEYVHNPKSSYKLLLEKFKKYENETKEIYMNYSNELKKLDSYIQILDLRKNENVQTELMNQFSKKQGISSESDSRKSILLEQCRENLKMAQNDVLSQQEVLLNLLADFKIVLSMKHQAKNYIKEDFEDFCKEKYSMAVPNLVEMDEFDMENATDNLEFCEAVVNDQDPQNISMEMVYEGIYKNLKDLMMVEMKRKANYVKKSIKWLKNK